MFTLFVKEKPYLFLFCDIRSLERVGVLKYYALTHCITVTGEFPIVLFEGNTVLMTSRCDLIVSPHGTELMLMLVGNGSVE